MRKALVFARARGAMVVAVSDDPLSPIARGADTVVPVRIETLSFLHAMTPAFATVERLAAAVSRGIATVAERFR